MAKTKKRRTLGDIMEESKAAMIADGTWYEDGDSMTAGQAVVTILFAIVAIPLAFVWAILSLAKGS